MPTKVAERALGETMRSLDEGTHVARDPQTLGEWIERWLETMVPKVRASTLRDYRNGLQRVSDRLGSVQLQALRPLDLEELYADLLREGKRYGGGLAPKTVRNVHIAVRRSLADAQRFGLVSRNVATLVKPPVPQRAVLTTWTAADVRVCLDLGGPSIVCIGGLSKPLREAAKARDYRRAIALRAEFRRRRTVLGSPAFRRVGRVTTSTSSASASAINVAAVGLALSAVNKRRTASGAMPARRASSALVMPCRSRARTSVRQAQHESYVLARGLVPSSRRFECHPDAIWIRPDRSRRCPVVDPEDAHLYRSLGCAAENLVHAGSLQQLDATAGYDDTIDAVVVELLAAPGAEPTELSSRLTTRQCTRTAYDGQPVSEDDAAALQAAGTGGGVECHLVVTATDVASIADLVDAGNRRQLTDRRFRDELVRWVRFNPAAALRTRDGLAGRVNGQPPLPSALGRLLAPLFIRSDQQVRTDRTRVESSAGIAAFTTQTDTKADWVAAGRAFERFALRADLLGIRTAFINQPIEVAELRPRLAAALSTSRSPQLLVRFGHAPYAPCSLRRPIDDVIIT